MPCSTTSGLPMLGCCGGVVAGPIFCSVVVAHAVYTGYLACNWLEQLAAETHALFVSQPFPEIPSGSSQLVRWTNMIMYYYRDDVTGYPYLHHTDITTDYSINCGAQQFFAQDVGFSQLWMKKIRLFRNAPFGCCERTSASFGVGGQPECAFMNNPIFSADLIGSVTSELIRIPTVLPCNPSTGTIGSAGSRFILSLDPIPPLPCNQSP